jgi:hypothetical protein
MLVREQQVASRFVSRKPPGAGEFWAAMNATRIFPIPLNVAIVIDRELVEFTFEHRVG